MCALTLWSLRSSNPRHGAHVAENCTKILEVAWLTVPVGVVFTIGACGSVLWWQALNFSEQYARDILIHGML